MQTSTKPCTFSSCGWQSALWTWRQYAPPKCWNKHLCYLAGVTENICSIRRAISQPLTGRNGRGRGRCADWWLQSVEWDWEGWRMDMWRRINSELVWVLLLLLYHYFTFCICVSQFSSVLSICSNSLNYAAFFTVWCVIMFDYNNPPTLTLLNVIKCCGVWFPKVAPLTTVSMSVSRYKIIQHTEQSHHKILVYYNM